MKNNSYIYTITSILKKKFLCAYSSEIPFHVGELIEVNGAYYKILEIIHYSNASKFPVVYVHPVNLERIIQLHQIDVA